MHDFLTDLCNRMTFQNVNREMKRPFPDRKKLEVQCVSSIAFVKNEADLLDSPIWIMLLNVVALEMLKAKMPDGKGYLFRKMFLNYTVSIF